MLGFGIPTAYSYLVCIFWDCLFVCEWFQTFAYQFCGVEVDFQQQVKAGWWIGLKEFEHYRSFFLHELAKLRVFWNYGFRFDLIFVLNRNKSCSNTFGFWLMKSSVLVSMIETATKCPVVSFVAERVMQNGCIADGFCTSVFVIRLCGDRVSTVPWAYVCNWAFDR